MASNIPAKTFFGILFLALSTFSLAGCAETGFVVMETQISKQETTDHAPADAKGVSVNLASLTGAPSTINAQFTSLFLDAAHHHNINIAGPAAAQFFTKFYLSADKTETGAVLSAVLDVFDPTKKYLERISSEVMVKTAAQNPWSQASGDQLTQLAQQTANRFAAFLSKTDTPDATVLDGSLALAPLKSEPAKALQIADRASPPAAARLALAASN